MWGGACSAPSAGTKGEPLGMARSALHDFWQNNAECSFSDCPSGQVRTCGNVCVTPIATGNPCTPVACDSDSLRGGQLCHHESLGGGGRCPTPSASAASTSLKAPDPVPRPARPPAHAPLTAHGAASAHPAAMEAVGRCGDLLLPPGMRTSRCSTCARYRRLVVDSTRNRRRIGGHTGSSATVRPGSLRHLDR